MNTTKIAVTLRSRRTNETVTVPADAIISWADGKALATWCEYPETKSVRISAATAARALGIEAPDIEQLEEWVHNDNCESVLGERIEPDGIDEHGSPSWLLVLGMV